jgi:hypothetical protein
MANRYWVGGTGNWSTSDTTHWSDVSGGAGGQTVPSSADVVIFNSLSSTANASYTVTCAGILNASYITMNDPGGVGILTFEGTGSITISTADLYIDGGTAVTWTYTGQLILLEHHQLFVLIIVQLQLIFM